MPKRGAENWARNLLLELIFWPALVSTFLWLYVGHYNAPDSAIAPHLLLVAMAWLGVVCMRIANARWMPALIPRRWIAAILIALPWVMLAMWYALILIGLSSWGRVTTWPLVKTYALQSGYLMDTLGLPAWLLPLAFVVVVVLPTLAAYRWLAPHDWAACVSQRFSISMNVLVVLLLGSASALQVAKFISFPSAAQQEPLSLSLFPNRAGPQLQSHNFSGTATLDHAETAARSSYLATNPDKNRNVILIVGDALRADHMSLYGYSRNTTPLLDKITRSRQSTTFREVRSACAESTCGLLALASSRPLHAMPGKPITLHEILRRNGYAVHMILGGDHTNFYGLKDVYGSVDSYFDGSSQKIRYMNDDRLVTDHVALLPAHDSAQPVMFQFHLMSTHGLGLRNTSANRFTPFTNYYRWPDGMTPTRDDLREAINYYDNGTSQFDQTVSMLLTQLEEKGYLRHALVVITGDHGEMLGEHGQLRHANGVHEGSLRIPLVLIRYGYTERLVDAYTPASQIDVAPTILNELGISGPSIWQGVALQERISPRMIHFQQSSLVGVYDPGTPGRMMKYWKDIFSGQEYIFDVAADPGERDNLINRVSPDDLRLWRREVMSSALIIREQ